MKISDFNIVKSIIRQLEIAEDILSYSRQGEVFIIKTSGEDSPELMNKMPYPLREFDDIIATSSGLKELVENSLSIYISTLISHLKGYGVEWDMPAEEE